MNSLSVLIQNDLALPGKKVTFQTFLSLKGLELHFTVTGHMASTVFTDQMTIFVEFMLIIEIVADGNFFSKEKILVCCFRTR